MKPVEIRSIRIIDPTQKFLEKINIEILLEINHTFQSGKFKRHRNHGHLSLFPF